MTVIWLTSFSGAGKTTIGNSLVENLKKYEKVIMLDGDELRKGLNSDLGFSMEDRAENIRRVAYTAKLLSNAGFLVITTLISPTKNSREQARNIVGENFIECYIKSDIETCIKRDVKGLYKKAINGEIKEFTGISSVYEIPENPELVLDTQNLSIEECTNIVVNFLVEKDLVEIMIIPDIESVNFGRGVGYEINEFVPNKIIEDISATKIRKSLNENNTIWTNMVPEKVVESLREHLNKTAE